jgi:hypothetical protein
MLWIMHNTHTVPDRRRADDDPRTPSCTLPISLIEHLARKSTHRRSPASARDSASAARTALRESIASARDTRRNVSRASSKATRGSCGESSLRSSFDTRSSAQPPPCGGGAGPPGRRSASSPGRRHDAATPLPRFPVGTEVGVFRRRESHTTTSLSARERPMMQRAYDRQQVDGAAQHQMREMGRGDIDRIAWRSASSLIHRSSRARPPRSSSLANILAATSSPLVRSFQRTASLVGLLPQGCRPDRLDRPNRRFASS